ncbi:Hypothetical predicted protein [Pelobates cultripes]|uniref:Uncharacterized protein n=1 Tax=Pelobates cultripes TaxID=61616 RepID=A0AAD1S9K2_PELCU|nr:Hypothetical predicted protein [Pelobates cultripes]
MSRNRCANIKIRGVPDSIGQAELPHYLRHLTETFLPHPQAKKLQFHGCYRINKSRQAPSDATHDIIVRWNTLQWRKSLGTVMGQLREAKVEYRWTLPRSTTVDDRMLRITSITDAATFLQTLGLGPHPDKPNTSSNTQSWDPARTRLFIPGREEKPGCSDLNHPLCLTLYSLIIFFVQYYNRKFYLFSNTLTQS